SRQDDLRTLRAVIDALDDGANPLTRRIAFRPRLLLPGQHGLDTADFHDEVAILKAFDRAVDHFSNAIVVLGVDVLALRLADLLEDDLFGGLSRDPPEHIGTFRELDLHVDFGLFA